MAVDPTTMTDKDAVHRLLKNAQRLERPDIVLACQLRIAELAGQDYDDLIEKEFWMAVTAAEEFKTLDKGRTTRLSRTRQKHKRVGALQCLTDWALSDAVTDGFRILIEAGRPDLTGEAIVMRHAALFPPQAVLSAKRKLDRHGIVFSSKEV